MRAGASFTTFWSSSSSPASSISSRRAFEVVGEGVVLGDQLEGRGDLPVLTTDFRVSLAVVDHFRVTHVPLELGEALLDLFSQFSNHFKAV